MGSKGSSTQVQNTNQTYTPTGTPYINQALTQAQGAASTPFQSYGGDLVAGFNPQQNLGISNINQYAGFAQPYIQNAQNYITQGAQNPLQNISQYLNPYTQNVVDATQRQFDAGNKVQQSQLLGNAASSGALGGDRQAVAQAELAKNQNLTQNPLIAGLYSQGFNSALGAAQTQQQALMNAGYGIGNLGTAGQSAGLQGAGAQFGIGQSQQQTQQAGLDSAYQQFLRQIGDPFQKSQFLTQATAGLAPSLGGTQQGQTNTTNTPAQPSILGQIAGLGMMAAGAYTGNPALMSAGAGGLGGGSKGSAGSPTSLGSGGKGSSGGGKGSTVSPGNIGGTGGSLGGLYAHGGAVPGYSDGGPVAGLGLLDHILPMSKAIRAHMNGGSVSGFADGGFEGGDIMADYAPETVSSGAQYAQASGPFQIRIGGGGLYSVVDIRTGQVRYSGSLDGARQAQAQLGRANGGSVPGFADGGAPDFEGVFSNFALPPPATQANRELALGIADKYDPAAPIVMDSGVPLPRPRPIEAPGLPQEDAVLPPEANPTSGRGFALAPPQSPPGASEYAPFLREAIAAAGAPRPQAGFAGSPGAALMSAGLGVLASGSPFPGVAIGQGGLHGMQTLEKQRASERQEADAAARQAGVKGNLAYHGMTAEQTAQRLIQSAKQHADTLAETARHHGASEALTKEQRDLAAMQPVTIGMTAQGLDIKAIRDRKSGDYRIIEPTTGKLLAPGEGLPGSVKVPGTYIDPSTGRPITQQSADTGEGVIPANAQLVSSSVPVDYTEDAPYIEKGMDVPKPAPVAGKSSASIQTDAENYLQTGKLPPVAKGKSPVAIQQNNYRNAVQNYGSAIAQSRGITPEQTAEMWRTAPGMLRFVLGADGRSTVALGTAVRHLDTVQELAKAWAANDIQAINRIRAVMGRQFGSEAATNLEASGRIVGPEIIKALGVAGAGTEHDRNTASEMFSSARSPAQLKGAVDTVQKLLGGQLEGRKKQAMAAGVSEEKFKSLIGDRPYEILSNVERGHSPKPTGALKTYKTPAEAMEAVKKGELKSGGKFLDGSGTERTVP